MKRQRYGFDFGKRSTLYREIKGGRTAQCHVAYAKRGEIVSSYRLVIDLWNELY